MCRETILLVNFTNKLLQRPWESVIKHALLGCLLTLIMSDVRVSSYFISKYKESREGGVKK